MASELPFIPGFTALSDRVLVREGGSEGKAASADSPELILIYGWGDGLPKHVAKYAEGYRVLYPQAKQIVAISPIAGTLFTDLEGRTAPMMTVVNAAFPPQPAATATPKEPRILVHAMSNAGACNYCVTLNAYRQLYGKPMPHQLVALDSTPGGTDLTMRHLKQWSRAMSLGTAAYFPWPFVVTQVIWGVGLLVYGLYERLVGRESAGAWAWWAVNDERYELKSARKLYMYSREDDLIGWEDVERHAAETRQKGWTADMAVFEGSGHVGHMRKAPEKYWKTIGDAWQRPVKGVDAGKNKSGR